MRFAVAFTVILFAQTMLHAALDPEINVPYQLRVVLRIGDHPHFTEHFRREIQGELQRQLQAALGTLGDVEVIDSSSIPKEKWPLLWKHVEEKGLESLESVATVGGGKTHFLRIDFSDGGYELKARQHDGTSGFVTPLVRVAHTFDRSNVVRRAALMIGQDFGLVATLTPAGATDKVFISAKASAKGSIDRWVKKGEVFAVIAIRSERRRPDTGSKEGVQPKMVAVQTGSRIEGLLLQVIDEPRDGVIPCRMWHRYEEPLPRGVAGFRCVKLGTTTSPLQLRLIDQAGTPQKAAALQVFARDTDFPESEKEAEQATVHDGVFVSKQPFANIAFVRVLLGNRRVARIPVEIMDNRVETRSIRLEPTAELRDRLDAERRGLLTRLTDERLIQVRCFQEITALEQAGKKAEALEKGQAAYKQIEVTAKEIQEEIENLQARATKALPKSELYANDCAQQLQILRSRQQELFTHLESLQLSIAEDNNPQVQEKKKRVKDLVRDAELLTTQAEYDKALAKYEEALIIVADEPAAKQRIESVYQGLKKAWRLPIKDAAHAKARKFIVETWPKLATPQDVRDQLPAARQAFEKCKAFHDRLAVNKMHMTSVEVAARFGDELKKLTEAAMDEEELRALTNFQKVSDELRRLLEDIQAELLNGQTK